MLHILTLTWNAADKLAKLKESLLPAVDGLDYQWVIKDNNSNDKTFEMASEWGNKVKVIKYKNNSQNFSQGVNFCFNEASPADNDYVMLLNNDTIINDPQSFKKMIGIMDKDPNVGVVGARLLFTNTNKLQHAGVVFDSKSHGPYHFRSNEVSDSAAEKNRYFQVVTGAVLLTKAGLFKNVCTTNKSGISGMDENYHWAFDDVDLCLSVKYNLNKKVVYCGKTSIYHEESSSLKKNPANHLFMGHNLNLLRTKWSSRYEFDSQSYIKNAKHNLYNG